MKMKKNNNKNSDEKLKELNGKGIHTLLSVYKYKNMLPAAKEKMIELMGEFEKEGD